MVPKIPVIIKMYWWGKASHSFQKFFLVDVIDNKIDKWNLINLQCGWNYVSTLRIVVAIKDLTRSWTKLVLLITGPIKRKSGFFPNDMIFTDTFLTWIGEIFQKRTNRDEYYDNCKLHREFRPNNTTTRLLSHKIRSRA